MARPADADPPSSSGVEPAPLDAATFEELMRRLELVVTRLERGELSLEQSLATYEEGIGLVRAAQGRLDGMDQRLEQLLADGRVVPLQGKGTTPRSSASPPPQALRGEDDDGDAGDGDDDDDEVDDDDGDDEAGPT